MELSPAPIPADAINVRGAAHEMRSDSPTADENLLELIPEHCPDLMALLDVKGKFLYGNAAHFLRLGRGPESLIGTLLFPQWGRNESF